MKKKWMGYLLAFMMVFSLCANTAQAMNLSEIELKNPKGFYFENAKINPDELEPEPPEAEDIKPVEALEPEVSTLEEENHLENSDEALELSEERVPEAVGEPIAFDLSKINTVAKGADGKFYGVRDYGNTWDNVLTKYFYEISEADYNALSQNFLMTFKRKDGQPFKLNDARMGDGDINDATPNYSEKPQALITEMQLRDYKVYDVTIAGNYSPMRVTGQENVTWSIELNKDWEIKATPGFTEDSDTRSIYMFYDVELDGKGHKIYRADNKNEIILQLGSGYNGAGAMVRTATLKNLTIDGDEQYECIKVYDKGVLNLENVHITKGNTNQANDGAGITLGPEAKLNMDAKSSITDCFASRGGAINAWEKTVININGSNISNNLADLGGAICSLDNASIINIKNATFDNNQAVLLSERYAYGGAIYTQSNTSIENSTFTNNFAQKSGGAVYYKGNNKLNLKGSTFKSNGILVIPQGILFTNMGGAIYSANEVNISDNCNFEGNMANYGGALVNGANADISKSTFRGNGIFMTQEGNYFGTSGGAIYAFGSVNISDNCIFELNIASKKGGAICARDKAEINNATFVNNQSVNGGAVYAEKAADINSSKFTENKAQFGGAVFDDGNSSFNDTTFEKNTAMYYGAGIYTREGINVTESKFIENTNWRGIEFQGAGIYIDKNAPNITKVTNTLFEKNSAPSGGAGIFIGKNSKLEVEGSRFIKNNAARGAGICTLINVEGLDLNKSGIKVTSSIFTDNTSYSGAGIYTSLPSEIIGSTFTNNKAALSEGDDEKNPHYSGTGGAVEVINNTTIIKGTTFEGNYAYGSGGALSINGVNRHNDANRDIQSLKDNISVEISEGTKFIGNICGLGQGGAIYTIPYLYEIEGYGSDVDKGVLKEKGYKNLSISNDTLFKENIAISGFFSPPDNYQAYSFLNFDKNTFSEKFGKQDVSKSLLNNYDINFKNTKIRAYFDPNGGELANEANPKAIKVIEKARIKENDEDKGAEFTILQAPKRDGYKFLGWKGIRYIPGGNIDEILKFVIEKVKKEILSFERMYKPGEKVTLKSNFLFVAIWEEDKTTPTPQEHTKYILTLDENYRGGEITDHEVEEGELIAPYLYIPRRRGYIFKGWSYDRKHLDEVKPEERIYSDTILYAIWKKAEIEKHEEPEEIRGEEHKAYIFGYPNGTVRPNGNITRAEAAAMLARLLNIEAIGSAAKPNFKDTESSWYNKAINAVVARGIMKGYPDGRFRPNAPITRAEFTQMISTIDNKPYGTAPFVDVKGHWAERAIGSEYQAKRITGYPDGLFRPDANITRAEAAVILNKIFERNYDAMSLAKCKNPQMIKRFIDLDKTFWGYNDMVEATNTHEYVRRYKGMIEEDWLLIK